MYPIDTPSARYIRYMYWQCRVVSRPLTPYRADTSDTSPLKDVSVSCLGGITRLIVRLKSPVSIERVPLGDWLTAGAWRRAMSLLENDSHLDFELINKDWKPE